ncbi:MAG: glycosyl transferase family 2 [Rhodopila sp.]|jgi:hypothetical protein|nr:glycosyl transferase family 2 [Rhodopila sp.]
MPSDTTLVVTSCGRPDLLRTTLDSFLRWNTYAIEKVVVVEDSGISGILDPLKARYRHLPVVWIEHPSRMGQIRAVDDAYAHVKTDYIFHCGDDWEFYRGSFIEESRKILEHRRDILQVWIRELDDTNGHPVGAEIFQGNDVSYRLPELDFRGFAHGFSFNPGLRRLADYATLSSYGSLVVYNTVNPQISEMLLGCIYKALGFRAAILTQGCCRHIGAERHCG